MSGGPGVRQCIEADEVCSVRGNETRSHRLDDAALVCAAGQGDRAAFGELFDRYFIPVFRFCGAQLGSAAAAEDVAGETFIRALSRISDFRVVPGTEPDTNSIKQLQWRAFRALSTLCTEQLVEQPR